jgi:hypothetical protein
MRVFGLWCRRQWSGRLGRQPEPDSRTAFVPIHLPVLPIETTQVLLFAPGADGGGGGLGFLPAEHRACRHQSSDFFPGTSDHDFFTLLNQVGSTRWAQPGGLNQVGSTRSSRCPSLFFASNAPTWCIHVPHEPVRAGLLTPRPRVHLPQARIGCGPIAAAVTREE